MPEGPASRERSVWPVGLQARKASIGLRWDNMTQATVIIVDDDHAFVDAVSLFLQKRGYRTRIGYNGCEGRGLLSAEDAAVAIIDVHMPDLGGLELVESLQNCAHRPAVILISADDSLETERRCSLSGAAQFLVKPIAPAELLRLVGALVNHPC